MHLSEINIYPIKSLKGITLDSATVEARGLRHDRRWMLTDGDYRFLTQREFPRMVLIEVGVADDGLYVTADKFGTLEIPLEPDTGDRQQVTIWQSICDGDVYPAVVNEWFGDVMGTNCRLVHMPEDSQRSVNPRFDHGDDIVSFADGYPLMLLGESTLADLNSRLVTPLPMNRCSSIGTSRRQDSSAGRWKSKQDSGLSKTDRTWGTFPPWEESKGSSHKPFEPPPPSHPFTPPPKNISVQRGPAPFGIPR